MDEIEMFLGQHGPTMAAEREPPHATCASSAVSHIGRRRVCGMGARVGGGWRLPGGRACWRTPPQAWG